MIGSTTKNYKDDFISGQFPRSLICICYEVKNSSFVDDCIELSDKTEGSKAYGHVSEAGPSKADDDKDMMEEQHARLAV